MTLAARALDYGYRDRRVGRGLDLELRAGEVACLLGPNGSGKSTLMRTLLGLQRPLAGEVVLDGRPLASWRGHERAARLAYVPQAAESYFDFSLREMVEMGRGSCSHKTLPTRLPEPQQFQVLGIDHLQRCRSDRSTDIDGVARPSRRLVAALAQSVSDE